MLFVDNGGITDPRINLALEEFVLRRKFAGEELLLFYINEPSIIVGRNQNTVEEVNAEEVRRHGIHVVRRISGGGAVYHDLGNLNFSFIAPYRFERFNRYDTFLKPVIDVLRSLGVPAELSGRNDLLADRRKISGNAQFASGDRMFSHGTVLFDTDLDVVTRVLTPKPGKIESKGHKSVRSRVANISEYLTEPISIVEFRARLLDGIFGSRDSAPLLELDQSDWDGVYRLSAEKYGTWDWNIGKSPPCNVQRAHRFAAGEIDARIDVKDGLIANVRFFGDYFGRADVNELERLLAGRPYDRDALEAALEPVDLAAYFGDVSRDDLLELICG